MDGSLNGVLVACARGDWGGVGGLSKKNCRPLNLYGAPCAWLTEVRVHESRLSCSPGLPPRDRMRPALIPLMLF